MPDVLIRDVPDDVLASVDARARELGLSRVEYIRRRLAADASTTSPQVTAADFVTLRSVTLDLDDEGVMEDAWR